MVGDLLLAFIVLCMAILVGYPLLKMLALNLRQRRSDR